MMMVSRSISSLTLACAVGLGACGDSDSTGGVVASSLPNLPMPTAGWPATVKYGADGCATADAHTAFVRRPQGCNPTPTGPGAPDRSWYATCGNDDVWTIEWFDTNLTCEGAPDRTDMLASPTDCGTNEKGEYERFFCYGSTVPAEQDPRASGAARFRIEVSLHSDANCSEAAFFMYLYQVPNYCMPRDGGASERWIVDDSDSITVESHAATTGCDAAEPTRVTVNIGDCVPQGPNAWGQLRAVDLR